MPITLPRSSGFSSPFSKEFDNDNPLGLPKKKLNQPRPITTLQVKQPPAKNQPRPITTLQDPTFDANQAAALARQPVPEAAPQPTATPTVFNPNAPVAGNTVQPQPPVQQQPQPPAQQQPRRASIQDLVSPSRKPFDIQDTELFKKSAGVASDQLEGKTPGFDAQANIARESVKVAQAQKSKSIREQLTQGGFKDTGKFIEEGIVGTEEDKVREREALERQLIADKAAQSQQTTAQGQQSVQNLLSLVQQGKMTQEQLQSQKDIAFEQFSSAETIAGLDNETKLALSDLQGKIQQGLLTTEQDFLTMDNALERASKEAIAKGDNATAERIEALRDSLARAGIASSEKVAFANIASAENIANLDNDTRLAITDLQGKIQQGLQVTDQDFREVENNLKRQHDLAIQAGDQDLARDIERMRGDLARAGFASSEKVAFARITSDQNMQLIDIDAQTELTELQGRINNDELLTRQSFEAGIEQLQREKDLAIAEGRNDTAVKIEEMQGALEKEMQLADQKYSTVEREANQNWASNERIDQSKADSIAQYNESETRKWLALNNNKEAARAQDRQAFWDLKLQTNGMNHEIKMTNLSDRLLAAQKIGDVVRQGQIMTFAHNQEMSKIKQQQGFEASQQYLNNQHDIAKDNNDFHNMRILEEMRFEQQNLMQQKSLEMEQAGLDLQAAGVDMARFGQQYQFIKDQVESGNLEPSDGLEFLTNVVGPNMPEGFEFTEPNANAVQNALQNDYINQQFQFALTFGDQDHDGKLDAGIYDDDGNFLSLNDENLDAFSNHLAETIYDVEGGDLTREKKLQILIDGTGSEELATNDALYQSFLDDPTIQKTTTNWNDWGEIERYKGDGGKARTIWPTFEDSEYVNVDGVLLKVSSINRVTKGGDDDTSYTLINPKTGQTTTITASDRNDDRKVDLAGVF